MSQLNSGEQWWFCSRATWKPLFVGALNPSNDSCLSTQHPCLSGHSDQFTAVLGLAGIGKNQFRSFSKGSQCGVSLAFWRASYSSCGGGGQATPRSCLISSIVPGNSLQDSSHRTPPYPCGTLVQTADAGARLLGRNLVPLATPCATEGHTLNLTTPWFFHL